MKKLIVQQWISLDGFATDRNGKLDFFAPTVREVYKDDGYKTFLDGIDSILFGRKTYEQFSALWPDRSTEGDFLATKINTEKKIVFSNSLTTAPWGKWNAATIESVDPVACIRSLKSSGGMNIVMWGSISLTQLAMRSQLVDEYHLFICPVITGGGKKLFSEGANAVSLKLISSRQYENGIVSLQYTI